MATLLPAADRAATGADPARGAPTWAADLRGERLALVAGALALTALFVAVHTLRLGTSALERGEAFDWGRQLARGLAHWWASLLFVPALARLVRAAPLARTRWVRNALWLVAGTLAAGVGRTLLDPPLAALLGDAVQPALQPTRVLGAFGGFLAVVGMLHAVHFHRELRAREREAAHLARSLAEARFAASEARLAALHAQLQPHFLFNTLNAVAALLHHEPYTADRMLTRLAELLRAALREPAAAEHALRDELALLDQYLDLMALRFGPRLTVARDVAPEALDVAVPWLVLQPLAENALEHGLWPRSGPGTLRVEAAREATGEGACLRLVVEDDGIGVPAGASDDAGEGGVGLANTRRRLAHLYGAAASLTLGPRPGGGARAVIRLPARAHG
jgi:signal transduction histidine kinase